MPGNPIALPVYPEVQDTFGERVAVEALPDWSTELLPEPSSNHHIPRKPFPVALPGVIASVSTTGTEVEQLSLALTNAAGGTASQDADVLAGTPFIVGSSLSATTTFWVQVEKFPAASVAVQVTVVVPNGYVELASAVPV